MEDFIQFSAKTKSEAITKACTLLLSVLQKKEK